jgi:hypothetical protein
MPTTPGDFDGLAEAFPVTAPSWPLPLLAGEAFFRQCRLAGLIFLGLAVRLALDNGGLGGTRRRND